MSFLPDIEDGQIKEIPKEPKLYTPPGRHRASMVAPDEFHNDRKGKKMAFIDDERLAEINNLNRPEMTEDFSDSPHLNI